jgi:hypothetical protein
MAPESANDRTQSATSAQRIFDRAPLGAIIRFSDRTSQPPARIKRKLQAWKDKNGTGRLVEKTPGSERFPAAFKLHIGDFGSNGITVVKFFRTYSVETNLTFAIASLPAPGSVLILHKGSLAPELLHVAADHAQADAWMAANRYSGMVCEPVPVAA